MRKATLARLEINISVAVVAVLLVLAGYSLVSRLADRLDPKIGECIARELQTKGAAGRPVTRGFAVALCKRLESVGAL